MRSTGAPENKQDAWLRNGHQPQFAHPQRGQAPRKLTLLSALSELFFCGNRGRAAGLATQRILQIRRCRVQQGGVTRIRRDVDQVIESKKE